MAEHRTGQINLTITNVSVLLQYSFHPSLNTGKTVLHLSYCNLQQFINLKSLNRPFLIVPKSRLDPQTDEASIYGLEQFVLESLFLTRLRHLNHLMKHTSTLKSNIFFSFTSNTLRYITAHISCLQCHFFVLIESIQYILIHKCTRKQDVKVGNKNVRQSNYTLNWKQLQCMLQAVI